MTSTAGLSPLQRRALHVMDIDLYVTRGSGVTREATPRVPGDTLSRVPGDTLSRVPGDAAPHLAGDAAPRKQPAAPPARAGADASSTEVAALPAEQDRDQPVSVTLDCLAGAGVVAVGTFADAADARFVQDVLAALTGSGTPLQKSTFKWPQTQTGDRRRAAAELAYAGFLNGQTDRAGARLLLLLGAAATMLLPIHRADTDYAVVECAAIGDLRRDPTRKKALWLSIRRFANH